MGKLFESITPEQESFIRSQALFFVGTAPSGASGHVNVSPKGLDTFRILGSQRVAYLDLTGSGNETAAHLLENERITFMFCSFGRVPQILRLYGTGRVIVPNTAEFTSLAHLFPVYPGTRQIIVVDIARVQTSCGFAVPQMELIRERDTLIRWAEAKGEQELAVYRATKNVRSIDGLRTPTADSGDDANRPSVLTVL